MKQHKTSFWNYKCWSRERLKCTDSFFPTKISWAPCDLECLTDENNDKCAHELPKQHMWVTNNSKENWSQVTKVHHHVHYSTVFVIWDEFSFCISAQAIGCGVKSGFYLEEGAVHSLITVFKHSVHWTKKPHYSDELAGVTCVQHLLVTFHTFRQKPHGPKTTKTTKAFHELMIKSSRWIYFACFREEDSFWNTSPHF